MIRAKASVKKSFFSRKQDLLSHLNSFWLIKKYSIQKLNSTESPGTLTCMENDRDSVIYLCTFIPDELRT